MKRISCFVLALLLIFPVIAFGETDPIVERIENFLAGESFGYYIYGVIPADEEAEEYILYAVPEAQLAQTLVSAYGGENVDDFLEWESGMEKALALSVELIRMQAEDLKIEGVHPVAISFTLIIPGDDASPDSSILLILKAEKDGTVSVVFDATGTLPVAEEK